MKMKLRKAIEIRTSSFGPLTFEPTDFIMINYYRNRDDYKGERVVFRLASTRIWNSTELGCPF